MTDASRPPALFSDFDGTLSPIVSVPDDARPAEGAELALEELAAAGWVVGVISGRSVAFLQEVLALPDIVYVGLHGLERAEGLADAVAVPAVAALADDLAVIRDGVAAALAGDDLRFAGVELEDKGPALTVHHRNAPDVDVASAASRRLLDGLVAGRRHVVRGGRRCWEVLPDLPVDKGTALRDEITAADPSSVTFIGDDIGDVHAFDALDHADALGRRVTRIAVRSAEMPTELARRADVVLDGPRAVVEWIAALA
jgi:trehalose 6-phosphate phosphatase